MNELTTLLLSLAGFGALIGFVVNLLKYLGVVKDGQAKTWVTFFNLVLLVALFVTQQIGIDLSAFDGFAAVIAEIGVLIMGLLVQGVGSKAYHTAMRGVPLLGKSLSNE